MHALTGEAVASFPELTDRAPLALVVDALLMRAADDAIGHGDRQHAVPCDELQDQGYLFPNGDSQSEGSRRYSPF